MNADYWQPVRGNISLLSQMTVVAIFVLFPLDRPVVGQDNVVPKITVINDEGKDVPYVPTPENVVEQMLSVVNVGPGDYVIDLGSGIPRIYEKNRW